jgi:hypothetical protein
LEGLAWAVSHRLPTAASRLRSRLGHVRELRFPLLILIPPTALYSLIILPSKLYCSLNTDIVVK